jgi:hypothetical protein
MEQVIKLLKAMQERVETRIGSLASQAKSEQVGQDG